MRLTTRPEEKKRRPSGTTTAAVIASGFLKLRFVDDIDDVACTVVDLVYADACYGYLGACIPLCLLLITCSLLVTFFLNSKLNYML